MDYRLTPMTERQLPQVAALERECFSEPWSEGIFRQALGSGAVLLTAQRPEGEVLGYAVLSEVLDEGNLDNIAVAPACRRQGIAEALLTALLRLSRGRLARIGLEVRASNAPAIALYQKFGFQAVGLRKNYYECPREDAVLMTLILAE